MVFSVSRFSAPSLCPELVFLVFLHMFLGPIKLCPERFSLVFLHMFLGPIKLRLGLVFLAHVIWPCMVPTCFFNSAKEHSKVLLI